MKLRFFILFLGLFFLIPATHAARFSDVPATYKYNPSIQALAQVELIGGYPDGTFKPESTLNRAELLKMVILSEVPGSVLKEYKAMLESGALVSPFPDVSAGDWFAPYVMAGYLNGVVKGYADGSFKPGQTVNLAESLKIMFLASNAPISNVSFVSNNLRFVKAEDWFAPYFSYADSNRILQSNKFYHGAQGITRGEFAEMLYRLRMVEAEGKPYTEPVLTSSEYRITIPRLSVINVKVSAGDPYDGKKSLDILKHGLGYYLGTPGSGKKMVLFGHSSGYSWDNSAFKTILRQIDKLQPGDDIYVNFRERGYHYKIRAHEIISASKDYLLMEDAGREEMALYTCWPPDSISHRYVIYADPA